MSDRLARSVPGVRDIGGSLTARGVELPLGGTLYNPADPMGKRFFNILATLGRARGEPEGKQPELTVYRVLECHQNAPAPSTPGGQ